MSSEPHSSSFKNGNFIWDGLYNTLMFVSREAKERVHSSGSVVMSLSSGKPHGTVSPTPVAATPEVLLIENVDKLGQAKYRKYFQRRVKVTEPEVVTLQDIKDVAIFITNISDLTPEFISYFHTASMDSFLRSLIVYFQYYFQVWDKMQARRIEASRKLRQPLVTTLENVMRDDLSDLRSMVARNYAVILLGLGDSSKYHHMHNKNNVSLSDKDRRLFECLMVMAVRVVWIALYRKYLSLIEVELNRLLRTNIFSPVEHKRFKTTAFTPRVDENRILLGRAFNNEKKLKHRSPAIQELIFDDHDYRMLAIGVLHLQPFDERQRYLEAAYMAPEELLVELNIGIGMLGLSRKYFDAMLKPQEKTGKRKFSSGHVVPHFKLPPKVFHSDLKIDMGLSKTPCPYGETRSAVRARKSQCRMWRRYVMNLGHLFTTLTGDMQSTNQSYMLSTKTSVLTWRE